MSISYSASSVTVKDGIVSADFIVKRSGTTSELDSATSVDFATSDVSATAGTDYTETSGSLSFASGVTEGTVSVTILSEAYTETSTKTFLLALTGYGSASCSIVPTTTSSTTQTYLYVPDDDNSVTVPTASDPGTNLKHQALYSGFSEPEDSSIDMPMAYFRLGYASSDLNEYERVILNSDNYHPDWLNHDDSNPEEFGPMDNFSLPRPINRYDDDDWKDKETDNAHLDGIFMYSDASYSVTVADQHSTIIKGDCLQEVRGRGRILWYDAKAEWTYVKGDIDWLYASGTTEIDGLYAYYTIQNTALYTVNSSIKVSYNLSAKYSFSTDVQFSFANDARYSVHNGIGVTVGGLEVDGKCDIYGNYSMTYPGGASVKTQSVYSQATSTSITLSVQTGYSTAWTTAVQVAAVANAAAAVAITSGDLYAKFASEGDFYKEATPEGFSSKYSTAFATAVPDACVALGLVTSVALVVACVLQQVADLVSIDMPKIEMDATGMTLSCGLSSELIINTTGVYITAPFLEVDCDGSVDITAGESVLLTGLTGVRSIATTTTVTGDLAVAEDVDVVGDLDVAGDIVGALVQAG